MRFMALQPKRMLSFDWNAPPSLPEARLQRSFVVVRLEPVEMHYAAAAKPAAAPTQPNPALTRPHRPAAARGARAGPQSSSRTSQPATSCCCTLGGTAS